MFRRGSSIFFVCLFLAVGLRVVNAKFSVYDILNPNVSIPLEEAPFMVKLRFRKQITFSSGILISPQHVLTRARSIEANYKSINITVIGGSNTNGRAVGVEREIAEIIWHPSYMETKMYDIAVLKLNEPFEEGKRIQVLNKFCSAPLRAGQHLQAFSFLAEELNTTKLKMISKDDCQRMRLTHLHTPLTNTSICAYADINKGCTIGFGGAAIYAGELCGVVSNSHPFCVEPAILTSIYAARDFIEDALKH